MVRVCGACLGLFAFAVAVLFGMAAGNPVATTLSRALWAMAAFYLLGSLLGCVAIRVVDEHAIQRHKELLGDEVITAPVPPASAKAESPEAPDARDDRT